jgi:hypothetical protein
MDDAKTVFLSMIGPVHCDLVETLKASRVITWCIAWMEMLLGIQVLMIWVERHGGVAGRDVNVRQSWRLLLGSKML